MGGAQGRLISYSDRIKAVKLINEATENGSRLEPACKELGICSRTYQRWTENGSVKKDQRPLVERKAPKNKLTESERKEIIKVANSKEYADLPPSKIVPKLADKGKYIASESTFYRVLKEEKLNAHRSKSKKPVKREIPTHIATKPNQVWTWDITWLNASIKGEHFKLYLIIDMFSRLIVAHEVWETENAEYSKRLIRKATLSQNIATKTDQPLVLHSDNGSPMKAATFMVTLEKLGVQSSFSRPRVSNDNPYSESLFKTMKYRPIYPNKGFKNLTEAREWTSKFVHWYNHVHLHSGINFITPYQRHYGLDIDIMQKRIETYQEAKATHPERWSGEIRDWSLPEYVTLNPMEEDEVKKYLNQQDS
ncbi:IS3 family transposase [Fuchsiella alkaliacetigena]|uniref:IS3 family transposase n=1 Tax=Fuchsiella alkaliacetigena TaxID=957042 RepID=UPI00200A1854|nr:IS3 family transposase [Fuchsiella alkaliacetigena]MCK8826121.1 IS3 family transposase [Fuchsiella alkaliacetigena]